MTKTGIRRDIVRRIRQRILLASLIYLVVLALIFLAGLRLGHSRIWYGTEPLYPFLSFLRSFYMPVGMVLYFLGELVILAVEFARLGALFQRVSDAMTKLFREDAGPIELPPDLQSIEAQMNSIKDQLAISRYREKEAEQRKNDLVVYLAHDLKTPLTSVMGYLMLLEENPDLPDHTRAKYLGIAVNKAQRLEELINEFFEITRFNLTTMELQLQRVNFTRLLEQTVFEFQPMLREKNMTCRLEGGAEVELSCDPDKLQRVVDNLLRSAVLYGYEGSEIVLRLEEREQQRIFICMNQGPTIPEAKLSRIFEQFYRLDSARTSSTGGAGLGLAIAKEIVRLHGGSIEAQSREERTVFTVTLPASGMAEYS